MRALICERAGSIGVGILDIAGRPLLVRQLQWLRDLGIEDVVVEIAVGTRAHDRAALLLADDPLTARCVVVPTRSAIGASALAMRAGLANDEPFLVLCADDFVHGALDLGHAPRAYRLPPPPFAPEQPPFDIEVRTLREAPASNDDAARSVWGARIVDLASAHALSCAALSARADGVILHAAEQRAGVWLARGARVSKDATLLPPVLIGNDARVFGDARIGPNVVVGAHSVIERDVAVSDAAVLEGTWIGEGFRARQAQIDARGTTSFTDRTRTQSDDPLTLSSTRDRGSLLTSRLVAVALLALVVVPWTLVFTLRAPLGKRMVGKVSWRGRTLHVGKIGLAWLDVVPALFDTALGRRDLVGVAQPRALEIEGERGEGPPRGGALDISWALAPTGTTSTLLAMWRWYAEHKSAGLDRALFWAQWQVRWRRFVRKRAQKK